jgi:hypothetical protein
MPHARQEAALLLRALPLALLLAGCAGSNGAAEPESGSTAPPSAESERSMTIDEVLKQRTPELMQLEGVVGVGQGVCDGTPCIRVYIVADSSAAGLPARLDGYRVDPVVTGPVRIGDQAR